MTSASLRNWIRRLEARLAADPNRCRCHDWQAPSIIDVCNVPLDTDASPVDVSGWWSHAACPECGRPNPWPAAYELSLLARQPHDEQDDYWR